MQARDIMSPNVITIRPEATIQDAARLLSDHRISGLPVVNGEQRVIGILSEIDIISKAGSTVDNVMSRRIISVPQDCPVDEVAQILTSHRIKRVPVMDGERLLGIVSRADIVRMMASRWTCQVCGSIHLGQMPQACADCGADGLNLARQLDPRPEISAR